MSGNRRKPGRKLLTKSELLPLPAARVRAISLENHLAFAAVRMGAGGNDQMSCLLRVVYLSWYLRNVTSADANAELVRQGEQALENCIGRAVASREWTLQTNEQDIVGQILSRHDEQLAVVPAHRYAQAWEQLQAFLKSGRASVLDS